MEALYLDIRNNLNDIFFQNVSAFLTLSQTVA